MIREYLYANLTIFLFGNAVLNLFSYSFIYLPTGLLDVVFDWYSLALSNTVIGWRKGYTEHVSTFVHSAQRVSGTTERTVIGAPIGHGKRATLYLVLSYPILSYLTFLSCLILSCLILSYLSFLSYLILSYPILFYLVLSYHILSYLILSPLLLLEFKFTLFNSIFHFLLNSCLHFISSSRILNVSENYSKLIFYRLNFFYKFTQISFFSEYHRNYEKLIRLNCFIFVIFGV